MNSSIEKSNMKMRTLLQKTVKMINSNNISINLIYGEQPKWINTGNFYVRGKVGRIYLRYSFTKKLYKITAMYQSKNAIKRIESITGETFTLDRPELGEKSGKKWFVKDFAEVIEILEAFYISQYDAKENNVQISE